MRERGWRRCARVCQVPFAAIGVFCLTALGPARVEGQAGAKRYTVPELVKAMSPAVVYIGNVNGRGEVTSFGSGFVVDATGIIVTNYHVIDGASDLQVKMKDGEIYDRVDVLEYDQRRDIAVIKIRAFKTLPTVALDEGEVEAGDDAVAIGNPKGLEHTVSAGIVSAFRQADGYRLIQISVPISPGSSGGPLFNLQGKVIGITSAGVVADGAQNLNFAVPIAYVRPLVNSKATPLPVAEFMKKMNASGGAAARAPSPCAGGSRGGPGDIVGVWSVAHDHGDAFQTYCLGKLYLTAEKIGYTNDSNLHVWEAPIAAVKEAAKNAAYGADKNAFHIRLTTNTNYNFVAVNDQLQFAYPDPILIAITKAVQSAK
jgi:S1-C subfamily serine protease